MPFERNSRFTGRTSELSKLEEWLFIGEQTIRVAITGLGGIGKTQLALELTYRTRARYQNCSVFWMPANDEESLHQAYLDVAQVLNIPNWNDEKADVKRLVQLHLSKESAGRWILIFDNADDPNMWIAGPGSKQGTVRLIECLPRSKQGCIIFTTRDRKTGVKLAQQNVVEVLEMDTDGATQLLEKCLIRPDLVNSQQDAKALLEELACLPLAIVQAAAYINENGIQLVDYLSLLAEQEEEVIDLLSEEFEVDCRYRNVKNPVATTWLISFEQIRRRDALAADYLSFMACVDRKDIPQSLLPAGSSRKKEIDAVGTLDAFSLITRRPADMALDLHRLVHLATRNWLRKQESLAQWTREVISRLLEVFPDSAHGNRSKWRILLPHARYVLESNLVRQGDEARIGLAWRYATSLYSDGRYNEAEMCFQEVMETRKRVLGQEHSDTLISIGNLALTYRNQGRWKEAEELQLQVVETKKKVLGQEHPDTLIGMGNLALTYRSQGRWKEAEELQLQVMEAWKKVLGQEHPGTLTNMGNLALTFWHQGRWKEAEELQLQVMETRKKVLGQEHPDILISMGNLASMYRNQGRWREAEELELQVMETRKKVLGQEHPDTLVSMNNLAWTWKGQNRDAEALDLMSFCLELLTRKLGANHPNTLACTQTHNAWKMERSYPAQV